MFRAEKKRFGIFRPLENKHNFCNHKCSTFLKKKITLKKFERSFQWKLCEYFDLRASSLFQTFPGSRAYKFSSALPFQNHIELLSTFLDESREAKCKMSKIKQTKTLLIQFQCFLFFSL